MNKQEKRQRINVVMRRISSQFPKIPEARLCCAIVAQAANDLLDKKERASAERYLKNAKHAELCVVDVDWVKESFEKAQLLPPDNKLKSGQAVSSKKTDDLNYIPTQVFR